MNKPPNKRSMLKPVPFFNFLFSFVKIILKKQFCWNNKFYKKELWFEEQYVYPINSTSKNKMTNMSRAGTTATRGIHQTNLWPSKSLPIGDTNQLDRKCFVGVKWSGISNFLYKQTLFNPNGFKQIIRGVSNLSIDLRVDTN